jgi:hypothetical protein
MKKRLLLMLIAVVCLSPSIVFADLSDNSYVGNGPMTFKQVDGETVSAKGSSLTIGPYNRIPSSAGPEGPNVAAAADCPFAAQRHAKHVETQIAVDKLPASRDSAGNAVGG